MNFDLWFTNFHSSQKSREPVNHGSQITQAPKNILLNKAKVPFNLKKPLKKPLNSIFLVELQLKKNKSNLS